MEAAVNRDPGSCPHLSGLTALTSGPHQPSRHCPRLLLSGLSPELHFSALYQPLSSAPDELSLCPPSSLCATPGGTCHCGALPAQGRTGEPSPSFKSGVHSAPTSRATHPSKALPVPSLSHITPSFSWTMPAFMLPPHFYPPHLPQGTVSPMPPSFFQRMCSSPRGPRTEDHSRQSWAPESNSLDSNPTLTY